MRIRSILIALLVVSCLLVLPFQHSYSQQIDRTSSDSTCGWSCWGANGNHTFSVPDECAPDLSTMELLWSIESDIQIRLYNVYDGYLYYGTNESLSCVDVDNGDLIWEKPISRVMALMIHNKNCFVLSAVDTGDYLDYDYHLISLNGENGQQMWEKRIASGYICYSPYISTNGSIIATLSKVYYSDTGVELDLYSIDDGSHIHSIMLGEEQGHRCGGGYNYFFFEDSIIIHYESMDDYDDTWSRLFSIDLNSFETQWSIEDDDEGYLFGYTPIISDDRLYIPSIMLDDSTEKAKLNCIQLDSGTVEWSAQLLEKAFFVVGFKDDIIYVVEEDYIYGFDTNTHKQVCKIYNTSRAWNIAVSDEKMFITGFNEENETDFAVVYDASTGKVLWQDDSGVEYNPMYLEVSDKKMFLSTGSSYRDDPGMLYCWGTPPPKGEPHRIRIEPSSAILNYNQSMQFTAKVIDLEENVLDEEITWSVVPEDAGKITADGLFMPSGEIDVCNIKATSCGKVSYCAVTIVYATLIKIEPSSASVRPGETVDFKARIVDRERKNILGIPKIWSLSNKDLGELTPLGTFTAGNKGGLSGEIICSSCGLEDRASIEIIDVNMENAITIDPETINFGKVSCDDEVSCEFTIFNHHSLPVRVDIAKFGGWFKLSRSELIIQPGESKTCTLSTVSDRLEPGVLFIGRLCLVWEGGRLSTQVTVDVEDQY